MNRWYLILVAAVYCTACGMPPQRPKMLSDLNNGAAAVEEDVGSPPVGGSADGSGSSGGFNDNVDSCETPPAFLLINEVYYDPVGVDTNGDVFIELYGEAGGCLKGYHIALINGDDGKTYKTIPIDGNYYVASGGLFVIADVDSSGATKVAMADILANFDPQNGPDAVQLISPDGKLVDAVAYGSVKVSKAENGFVIFFGMPAPDAPSGASISRLDGVEPSGDNSIDFVINKTPSPGSFDVGTLPGGASSSASGSGSGSGSSSDAGSASSSNTDSAAGSSSASDSGSGSNSGGGFNDTLDPCGRPPEFLFINEVYYDAVGVDTNGDVFIELYGEPQGCLMGYHIVLVDGGNGKTYKTLPIDGILNVGDNGLFVIADVDSSGATKVAMADILANFDPQNGPDTIQLIGPDGNLVDVVAYGGVSLAVAENGHSMFFGRPAPDAPSGASISRLDGVEPSGDNSIDFVINKRPSPGSYDVFL